jgi:hypothetical protein
LFDSVSGGATTVRLIDVGSSVIRLSGLIAFMSPINFTYKENGAAYYFQSNSGGSVICYFGDVIVSNLTITNQDGANSYIVFGYGGTFKGGVRNLTINNKRSANDAVYMSITGGTTDPLRIYGKLVINSPKKLMLKSTVVGTKAQLLNLTGKPFNITGLGTIKDISVIGPTLYAEKSVNGGNNSNVCFYPMDTRTTAKKYMTWFSITSGIIRRLKYYDGSIWKAGALKSYDGSAWVEHEIKSTW